MRPSRLWRRVVHRIDRNLSALAAGNDVQHPRDWAREGRVPVSSPREWLPLVTHLSSFHIPTFTIVVHAAITSQRRALPLIDQHISALAAGNDAQQPRGWAREGRAHVYRPASPENAARKMRKTTAGQNEPRRQKGGRCPEGAARGTGARICAAIYTTKVAAAARGRP